MSRWHKTGCVLCAQNCGLEILVENNRMVKVKPDKSNPRSQGYACRKGLNVIYHQYPKDRINEPLKRVGAKFQAISWEQAIDEITTKMKDLVQEHGPRALAYMGASALRPVNFKGHGLPVFLQLRRPGVFQQLVVVWAHVGQAV